MAYSNYYAKCTISKALDCKFLPILVDTQHILLTYFSIYSRKGMLRDHWQYLPSFLQGLSCEEQALITP